MNNFFKRNWPLLGLVCISLMVFYFFIKSSERPESLPSLEKIIPEEGIKLKNIHYTNEDSDNKIKWALDADEVRFSGDKSSIFFNDFKLTVEPADRSTVKLNGKRGSYFRDKGIIELWGDIVGVSDDGYMLKTGHLKINEKNRQMTTDDHVMLYGPLFTIEGKGLFSDFEKEVISVLSETTATMDREFVTK